MTRIPIGLAAAAIAIALSAPAWADTYQQLSPGNKKIVTALYQAQQTKPGGPSPLTLDQLAALNDKDGWGNAFKQLKAQHLIDAKNLGQVVSAYERHLRDAPTTTAHAEANEHGGAGSAEDHAMSSHAGGGMGSATAMHGAGHGH
jgi:hypothetical protein